MLLFLFWHLHEYDFCFFYLFLKRLLSHFINTYARYPPCGMMRPYHFLCLSNLNEKKVYFVSPSSVQGREPTRYCQMWTFLKSVLGRKAGEKQNLFVTINMVLYIYLLLKLHSLLMCNSPRVRKVNLNGVIFSS